MGRTQKFLREIGGCCANETSPVESLYSERSPGIAASSFSKALFVKIVAYQLDKE
ncbi:MAG: hypothetical protein ACQEWE_19415 [Bacillota bacterium]